MNPWLETTGAAALALAGWIAGLRCSRLKAPFWAIGWVLPVILIVLYALGTRVPSLSFVPPISWMMTGRIKYAIIGIITPMVFGTTLSRLPSRRDRIAVRVFIVAIVCLRALWPFLAPAFNQAQLRQLKTVIDDNGVCRQGTGYNCGPAAAVTALRKLGVAADEGELAILARTTSATGTPPDDLAIAIQSRYGGEGVVAEYRQIPDIAGLNSAGVTIAVTKYGFLVDHYVTVLEVTDKFVIVGDPASGKRQMSHEDFNNIWRRLGVALRRTAPR